MRYTSAFGAIVAFGGSLLIPGDSPLRQLARALLDGVGLVFAVHLVVLAGLAVVVVRPRSPQPVAGPEPVAGVVPRSTSPVTQPIPVGTARPPRGPAIGPVADAAPQPRTPVTGPLRVQAPPQPTSPDTQPLQLGASAPPPTPATEPVPVLETL